MSTESVSSDLRDLTKNIHELLRYQYPIWHPDTQKAALCWHRAYEKAKSLPEELRVFGQSSDADLAVLVFLVELSNECSVETVKTILSRFLNYFGWNYRRPISTSEYLYRLRLLESTLRQLERRVKSLSGLGFRSRRFWHLKITSEMMRSESGALLAKMEEIRRWWVPLPFFLEVHRVYTQREHFYRYFNIDEKTQMFVFSYMKGPDVPSVYTLSMLLELFPQLGGEAEVQQLVRDVGESLRDPEQWEHILEDPASGDNLISHRLIPHPDHFHWRLRERATTWSGITRHLCLLGGVVIRCIVPQFSEFEKTITVGKRSMASPTPIPEKGISSFISGKPDSWVPQTWSAHFDVEFRVVKKRKTAGRKKADARRRAIQKDRQFHERVRSLRRRMMQQNKNRLLVIGEFTD